MIKRRKANILTENIIFIILNLLFLSILILFVFSKSGGAAVLEEKYSKQIALILDSAKPGMTIRLNMDDALNKKEKDFAAFRLAPDTLREILSVAANATDLALSLTRGMKLAATIPSKSKAAKI